MKRNLINAARLPVVVALCPLLVVVLALWFGYDDEEARLRKADLRAIFWP